MRCGVCDEELGETFVVREMMYATGEEFLYGQCGVCGSLWLTDPPLDLSRYYGDDYYSLESRSSGWDWWDVYKYTKHRAYHFARALHLPWPDAVNRPSYARFGDLAGLRPRARVLDVGCGAGQLLQELQKSGFRHLTGFDPYLPAGTNASGVKLVKGEWDDVDGEFDVIMMHHSLEHVAAPVNTLKSARNRLSVSGRVIVRIPIVARAWQVYGVDWVQLDAPRHMVIFSLEGMLRAAEYAGLTLVSHYCDSTSFQFWGSEQYRLGVGLDDPRSVAHGVADSPFTQDDIDKWETAAQSLNDRMEGDQATFVFAV